MMGGCFFMMRMDGGGDGGGGGGVVSFFICSKARVHALGLGVEDGPELPSSPVVVMPAMYAMDKIL